MDYIIRQVKLVQLNIIALSLIIIPFSILLLLSNYFILNVISFITIIIFICIAFVLLYFKNNGILHVRMSTEGIYYNKDFVLWSEIKGYKIKNDASIFRCIYLFTTNKKLAICHRKKFSDIDDLDKFILDFENKIQILNNEGYSINKIPIFIDSKIGMFIIFAYLLLISIISISYFIFNQITIKSFFLLIIGVIYLFILLYYLLTRPNTPPE